MFSILRDSQKLGSNSVSQVCDEEHFIFGRTLKGPHPEGTKKILLGMGCFWGVEKLFWSITGVEMTAVGYSGGTLINPTYEMKIEHQIIPVFGAFFTRPER